MKQSQRLLIAAACLLLCIGMVYRFYHFETLTLTIEKAASSGIDDRWRLFVGIGARYNPSEYFHVKVKAIDKIVKFDFQTKDMTTFRIEPGVNSKHILIKNICIRNSRQKICWDAKDIVENFTPVNHISEFVYTHYGLHIECSGGNPLFLYNNDISKLIDTDSGSRKYIFYMIAVLLSVGIYLVIPFIVRFFQNHPEYLDKIILTEKTAVIPLLRGGRGVFVWAAVFSYLCLWAVIKPPGQSPDEAAHVIKIFSIPQYLWMTPAPSFNVNARLYNPLMDYSAVRFVPTHYKKKFTQDDYLVMKSLAWRNKDEQQKVETPAYSYPHLYYMVIFSITEIFKKVFDFSPFDTFYAYRLITSFIASLLWLWVYHALMTLPQIASYRRYLFWAMILVPSLEFITSSANPDAFNIPLTVLCMIYSYSAIAHGKSMAMAITVLLLNLFVKPAALLIFPTIAVLSGGMLIFCQDRIRIVKRSLILTVPAFVVSFAAFYKWSSPVLYGNPVTIDLISYIKQLPPKLHYYYFIMYWGDLGWLDLRLDGGYYEILTYIIIFNVLCAAVGWRNFKDKGWAAYFLFFALIYCAGLIGGEFHYLTKAGYTLQGRYFLPVALGLSTFLVHRCLPAIYLFMGYILIFNAAMIIETLYRYFALNISVFLPF
jgi:ABC-type multidrug transport system fused ATPase/permease subunit